MSIRKFYDKYKNQTRNDIAKLARRWKAQQKADELLGTEIMTGVIVSDVLINGVSIDDLPTDLKESFTELMKGKADSYTELRELIIEKYDKTPKSIEGLMNKIQGQYGENIFKENIGNGAELAKNGSQEGWDIKVPRNGFDEHIQVKVYKDSDSVIEQIKKVNEKIEAGQIKDVDQINFAVNSDIFLEVRERAEELDLQNKIYFFLQAEAGIRDTLEAGFEAIKNTSLLDNFFSEIFSLTTSSASIHAASNAFLVWKCSKEKSQAIEDTIYSSAISTGGIITSVGSRAIITEAAALTELELIGTLLGPVGLVTSIGVGYGTREYLKRLSQRRDLLSNLNIDLKYNEELIESIKATDGLKKAS